VNDGITYAKERRLLWNRFYHGTASKEHCMKILTIDRKDTQIDCEAAHLVIYRGGMRKTIPLKQCERILVSTSQQISTKVFAHLAKQGISLIIINRHAALPPTLVVGHSHGDIARRMRQYQLVNNEALCTQLARSLIAVKLRAQKYYLKKALKLRPDKRKAIIDADKTLAALLERLRHEALSLDQIRGIEGAGAASYFAAFKTLFPSEFQFHGRQKRPPKDPVNALLSLTYTLLYSEAVIALTSVGLEPSLGVLHKQEYGRMSLACDLQELYRAWLDFWVWRLIAERKIRTSHFLQPDPEKESACYLNKEGRQLFYKLWSGKVALIHRHMLRTLRQQIHVWL
jgi:CRISPR-associated protein Cas1